MQASVVDIGEYSKLLSARGPLNAAVHEGGNANSTFMASPVWLTQPLSEIFAGSKSAITSARQYKSGEGHLHVVVRERTRPNYLSVLEAHDQMGFAREISWSPLTNWSGPGALSMGPFPDHTV